MHHCCWETLLEDAVVKDAPKTEEKTWRMHRDVDNTIVAWQPDKPGTMKIIVEQRLLNEYITITLLTINVLYVIITLRDYLHATGGCSDLHNFKKAAYSDI